MKGKAHQLNGKKDKILTLAVPRGPEEWRQQPEKPYTGQNKFTQKENEKENKVKHHGIYSPGLTTGTIKPRNKNIFLSCMKQDVVLQLASTYLQLLGLLVQSFKKRSFVLLCFNGAL